MRDSSEFPAGLYLGFEAFSVSEERTIALGIAGRPDVGGNGGYAIIMDVLQLSTSFLNCFNYLYNVWSFDEPQSPQTHAMTEYRWKILQCKKNVALESMTIQESSVPSFEDFALSFRYSSISSVKL